MAGLYYEEFFIDQEFDHPWSRTVTEMDNTLFSALTLNVQPLHLDAHFAAGTEFGQRNEEKSIDISSRKVVAMRESRSRPDVGIVDFEHTCWNQRGEMVAICRRQAMMRKKPQPA